MPNDDKNKVVNTAEREAGLEVMLPGGVEAQERRGQAQLLASRVLPRDGLAELVGLYGPIGLERAGDVANDPLFAYVELPPGWKLERTTHSMWTELRDERGRKRAGVFYKAAYYDRKAHMYIEPRYKIERDMGEAWDRNEVRTLVTDGGERIYATSAEKLPEHYEALSGIEGRQRRECAAWLAARNPDHADPVKSWEAP